MQRRKFLTILSIGLGAVLAGALLARLVSSSPVVLESGTWLPEPRELGAFQLSDQAGHTWNNASLQGHPSLVFFGYTYCPDICPTTLAMLAEVLRRTPLEGARVLFVSVDPERDSAATLKDYVSAFNPDFIGLRGDEASLEPFMRSLGAIAMRQPLADGNYTMDHSATLFLLDKRGQLAAVFSPPLSAERLTADFTRIVRSGQL
jgi:protein SCO1/2